MLPPLKKAKLAAVALASSLKISKADARNFLSQALNYETWDGLIWSVNNKKNFDKLDAELSADIADNRLREFASNLNNLFDLNDSASLSLARAINPFSSSKPKTFRIDLKSFHEGGGINIGDMLGGVDAEEGMMDFLKKMAKDNPELSGLKDIDSIDEFTKRMRISHPMDPSGYYNALENLTDWSLDDTLYESEYTYLEESFHIESEGSSYPVYIFSLACCPGDTGDDLFEEIKDRIAAKGSRALTLFKAPVWKVINGVRYSVLGSFFNGSVWSWTLLNDMPPEKQAELIGAENIDLETPVLGEEFGEKVDQIKGGYPTVVLFQAVTVNMQDEKTGKLDLPDKIASVTSTGGWVTYMM